MVWVINYLQGPCVHIVVGGCGLHELVFPVAVALVVRELVFGAILCDPGLADVVDYLLQSFCYGQRFFLSSDFFAAFLDAFAHFL